MKHERELIAREVLPCPDMTQKEKDLGKYHRRVYYRVRSELAHYADGDALGITVYDAGGLPAARAWINGTQHGAQVFAENRYGYSGTREAGKMYGARLESLMEYESYYADICFYGEAEDEERIRAFLGVEGELYDAIKKHQRDEDQRRCDTAVERKKALIRREFEGIEPASEEFRRWLIDESPLKECRYLWYAEAGKKRTTALCSHCGETSPVEGAKENNKGVCPSCGSMATYRSGKRMARTGSIEKSITAATLERHQGNILVRTYAVTLHYPGARPVAGMQVNEMYRHIIDAESGRQLRAYTCHVGTNRAVVDGFAPTDTLDGANRAHIYPGNLAELRAGTGLKYMPLEELPLEVDPDWLWENALHYPIAEYFIKAGLHHMAEWLLHGCEDGTKSRALNLEGKRLAEVLGVGGDELRLMIASNAGIAELELFKTLRKCGVGMSAEQLELSRALGIRGAESAEGLCRMARASSMGKALRYIRSQGENGNRVLTEWKDYLSMAKEIGIELSDGMRMFPKKLKVAHDEAQKVKQIKKDEALNRRVAKTADTLEQYRWEFDGLLIRPARSQTELWEEGKALHHCVGRAGYAQKMAEGRTAIFFIRRKDKPDTPLATLELDLSKWHIVQCYGDSDKKPGEQIQKFTRLWVERVINAERKTA